MEKQQTTNLGFNIYRVYRQYASYLGPVVTDPMVRGYFGLIASLLLVSFFGIFALSPTINTIIELRKKIADNREINKALETKIANLALARENLAQAGDTSLLVAQALPVGPEPQSAVTAIVSSASASGISLSSFRFGTINFNAPAAAVSGKSKVSSVPGVESVSFTLNVSGPQKSVRVYFSRLEDNLRYIRIVRMSVAESSVEVAGLGYFYKNVNE